MQMIKRTYVDAMQNLGEMRPLANAATKARHENPYSWQRWFASLFAIYETDRMIALDLPWWNVAATREVESFLAARKEARIFEYGSGASTVWLARRAGEVFTVEHDKVWLDKFARQTESFAHVNLLHRSIEGGPQKYVSAIDEVEGEFDMIVVDGRHRAACLAHASPRLANGGILLFDDSGRSRYRAAIEGSELCEKRYYGMSYCVPYPDYTSLMRHGHF